MIYIVKGMRPCWKYLGKEGYTEPVELSCEENAKREKSRLQRHGFIKVCIKRNKKIK